MQVDLVRAASQLKILNQTMLSEGLLHIFSARDLDPEAYLTSALLGCKCK